MWKQVGVTEIVEDVSSNGGVVKVERVEKCDLFHVHSLRRSFATMMYLDGIPLKYLRLILGHSSEKQTEHYINISARLNAAHVAKHMEMLDKINKS